METFSNLFSIMANKSFTQQSREKDNLIKIYSNLLKIRFRKRTHVFDNTMIFPKKTFQRKGFRNSDWKHENHTTWQNSWSYVTIRELQARKHNQFSAIKRLLRKTRFRKDEHLMISKLRYLSFLETKIRFKNS